LRLRVGWLKLIGIVKKNAIMMISFALVAEREQGPSPAESIHLGAVLRFRPIMMTTMGRRSWARCGEDPPVECQFDRSGSVGRANILVTREPIASLRDPSDSGLALLSSGHTTFLEVVLTR